MFLKVAEFKDIFYYSVSGDKVENSCENLFLDLSFLLEGMEKRAGGTLTIWLLAQPRPVKMGVIAYFIPIMTHFTFMAFFTHLFTFPIVKTVE